MDGVLDQVEEHALQLVGVAAGRCECGRELRRHGHGLGVGGRAHRLHRLAQQRVQPHLLHGPRELAALQSGELEEIVDQGAEGAHVGADARRVVAAVLGVDEAVVDGVGQQPQGGDRGAQVVGNGGDEVASRPLLAVEPRHHGIDVGRQAGELVASDDAGAHVASALANEQERRSHRVDVVDGTAPEQVHGPRGQRGGVGRGEHGEERVVAGDEHLVDEEHDRGRELHHRDHGDDRELAAQAAHASPRACQRVGDKHYAAAQRREDLQRGQRCIVPVANERHRRHRGGGRDREAEAAGQTPHAAKR